MANLYLIGSIQALFFILLILTKKGVKKSDIVLSIFLLILGCKLFYLSSTENGFYLKHPLIILAEVLYWTLLGPALFIYIDLVASEVQRIKIGYIIHLIPTVIVLAGISPYLFSEEYTYLTEYRSDTIFFIVSQYVWLFNTHAYYILCLIWLRKHSKRIRNQFSNTKYIDLKWLRFLTYGFALFLFYLLTFLLSRRFLDVNIPFINHYVSWVIMIVYIFGIGFYGFKQKGLFSHSEDNVNVKTKISIKKPQYAKSGLSSDERDIITSRLLIYLQSEKPYLNSELDIRQLADRLNLPVHKLSQSINQNLNKTFFDLINEFRIKEAATCLKSEEYTKYSIISIAYDCGFNSKTSFYKLFKKYTSHTPTQYRDLYLSSN